MKVCSTEWVSVSPACLLVPPAWVSLLSLPTEILVYVSWTLTKVHEAPAVPVAPAAAPLVPHVGVVGLGALVLHPSRFGGDGDDVKNNSEQQQQGNDPPAAGEGEPTAKHVRRSDAWSGMEVCTRRFLHSTKQAESKSQQIRVNGPTRERNADFNLAGTRRAGLV